MAVSCLAGYSLIFSPPGERWTCLSGRILEQSANVVYSPSRAFFPPRAGVAHHVLERSPRGVTLPQPSGVGLSDTHARRELFNQLAASQARRMGRDLRDG